MNYLEKVQKMMKVLQLLSRIAMIIVYVSAGLTLIGALLLGFSVVSAPILVTTVNITNTQIISILIAATIILVLNGVLLTFTYQYFTAELNEGTPFTVEGANRIKLLGIKTIIIAIASSIIIEIIYSLNHLSELSDFDSSDSVMLGIVLILLSFIFRYGAELEQKKQIES